MASPTHPQVIREKVIERRLPMAILDAEYQFDHHKLVYFFEADRYESALLII